MIRTSMVNGLAGWPRSWKEENWTIEQRSLETTLRMNPRECAQHVLIFASHSVSVIDGPPTTQGTG